MKHRLVLLGSLAAMLAGCTVWDLHGLWNKEKKADPQKAGSHLQLVGELAVPFNTFPVRLEAVSIVMGLNGTGSDPEPSPQRAMLMEEMKRRGVKNPNQILASRNAALVLVRAVIPPGIQKGDPIDVELHTPPRSETTSLRGGFLLETELKDMAVKGNEIFNGKCRAFARGPVLVDPSASEKSDKVLLCRGGVLGGGLALEPRPLGLMLNCGDETQMTAEQLRDATVTSSRVSNAINRRFHTFKSGIKVGVATAKTGKYVDLLIHPRYKDNVGRYMQVLRSVALEESVVDTSRRILKLEQELFEPSTAAKAALELEAIGTMACPVLLKGIKSADPEVRFCAAESLAYLEHAEAADPLAEAARQEPAFRVFALSALATMDEFAAGDQLRELLSVPSVETRYGAFRALWKINPKHPLIRGENLGGQFSYHVLEVGGPPLIHVTRSRRAEVVLFGPGQRFLTPLAVNAGPRIMVTSGSGSEQISVSRFAPNEPDRKRSVSTRVDDVIRAIVELGGTYPDVVQALQEAKAAGALGARFEVDALPEAGRVYDHESVAAAKTPTETKK